MNPIQLSFAFSAGIAAALNPCGVAILPSYISYLLTRKSEGDNCSVLSNKQTPGGLTAGLTITAGLFSIFGFFGLLLSLFGRSVIAAVSPWFSLAVGIILVYHGVRKENRRYYLKEIEFKYNQRKRGFQDQVAKLVDILMNGNPG